MSEPQEEDNKFYKLGERIIEKYKSHHSQESTRAEKLDEMPDYETANVAHEDLLSSNGSDIRTHPDTQSSQEVQHQGGKSVSPYEVDVNSIRQPTGEASERKGSSDTLDSPCKGQRNGNSGADDSHKTPDELEMQ